MSKQKSEAMGGGNISQYFSILPLYFSIHSVRPLRRSTPSSARAASSEPEPGAGLTSPPSTPGSASGGVSSSGAAGQKRSAPTPLNGEHSAAKHQAWMSATLSSKLYIEGLPCLRVISHFCSAGALVVCSGAVGIGGRNKNKK